MKHLMDVLNRTDWAMLAQQKVALVTAVQEELLKPTEYGDGLLNWIDAIQDAAEKEGYPVVFLTEDE
jgi:hypothetical protein